MRNLVLFTAVALLAIPAQVFSQNPRSERWERQKAQWAQEQAQRAQKRQAGSASRDGFDALRARDYARAAAQFQIACTGGVALGCYELGVMYQNAVGVQQNFSRAAALFQSACTGRYAMGCNNLGVLYYNGQGVGRDFSRAAVLYQSACTGGEALGCTNLDGMYEQSCKAGSASDCSKLDARRNEKQAQIAATQARIAANLRPSPGGRRPKTFEGYSGPLVECMEDFPSVAYTEYLTDESCLANAEDFRRDPKSCPSREVTKSTVYRYKNLCPFDIHTKIISDRWGSRGKIIYSVLESGVEHQRFLSTSAGTIVAMSKEPFNK